MADYGIKVSKPGYDIATADIHDTALWSKYPVWKVKVQGSTSCSMADGVGTCYTEISHNLDYFPQILCFWEDTDEDVYVINTSDSMVASGDTCAVNIDKTNQKIYLRFSRSNTSGSETMYAYYYIFYDVLDT